MSESSRFTPKCKHGTPQGSVLCKECDAETVSKYQGSSTAAVNSPISRLREWLRDNAPDCGDNSCLFGGRGKGGVRTNGGCRCFKDLPTAKRIYVERLYEAFTQSETQRSAKPILTTATEPQGREVTQGEARLHHPAPECEGEIAARESLEPEGPLMPAKSAGSTERLDGGERPALTPSHVARGEPVPCMGGFWEATPGPLPAEGRCSICKAPAEQHRDITQSAPILSTSETPRNQA